MRCLISYKCSICTDSFLVLSKYTLKLLFPCNWPFALFHFHPWQIYIVSYRTYSVHPKKRILENSEIFIIMFMNKIVFVNINIDVEEHEPMPFSIRGNYIGNDRGKE